ncbi:uncharacterized protein PgNI_08688 [Pyricularia grisea]|uniref:BHLH domain-containing protein n=1 Tax=Pyricularia grisea TaxID=148305 RepID=A0A6P8AUM8_PYRGI|nr:uncharacterized protein PgNI_08688 [Pyricularia grisea]TLD05926.1 hypothetical protein PgNI_08688 [Pyricularia grisea]
MAGHEDSASAVIFGGLEDPSLSNFFGADDPTDNTNNNTNPNSTHNSPAGPNSVFTAESNWPTFEETPPYDAYESTNPFDTLYPAPQFAQQQWQPPQGAQFHGQPLPQRTLAQQQPSGGPSVATLSPSDLSPVALQAESVNLVPSARFQPNPAVQPLTLAQQERLKNIAMPAHLQYHSPKSEPSPNSSPSDKEHGDTASSPEATGVSKTSSRKRKSSADDEEDDDDDGDGSQPVKKTAHNMIEKRYRTNLNDKIAALRDSVPSLRIMSKSARGEDTTEDREELHGLTPAHKLNKATVLSKATEYIRHLEKRNNRLMSENESMQQRISAFEKLFMAGAMNGGMSPIQQPPTPIQFPTDAQVFMGAPMTPGPDPQGMIQVPEDMKRIIQAQAAAGRPYPIGNNQGNFQQNAAILRQQQIQQQQQQQIQQNRWGQTAPYFGKMMVGSLAGLMILEAVRENEQSTESPEGRGLFAIPLNVLGSFVSQSHVSIAGHYVSAGQIISSLKFMLLFAAILYSFVPAMFSAVSSKPHKAKQQVRASLAAVPSLASPIHVRRDAWLTAIQTVWVPRHNFILEAAALVIKTMKLSLRNAIGIHGYQVLTGLTEEQETARVKAWAIALDAQLAGGDVEINKSRLTLTLLASGTLPDTPLRLMLKALHIRVLLWQFSKNGLLNLVAAKLARSQWNKAKQLFRLSNAAGTSQSIDDALPDHLAVLLDQDCDDVLNDDVVQRAHNLAWNRPTTHNVVADVDGMNAVVEDPAIKSPLDAVAAWWSSLILHQVLITSLTEGVEADNDEDKGSASSAPNDDDIILAAKVAPIGSNAQVRAIVARSFLCTKNRGANIAAALEAITPSNAPNKFIADSRLHQPDNSRPIDVDPDARMALHCAMVAAHLTSANPKPLALDLVSKILRGPTDGLTLLGFAAAFGLIVRLHQHPIASESCSASIERMSGALRIWIGGPSSDRCALGQEIRHDVVQRCLAITRAAVGMETDPGYGSMSEEEQQEARRISDASSIKPDDEDEESSCFSSSEESS